MKRTPLKRKTPLRRGKSTLKKSRLKPMSREKKAFYVEYVALCSKDGKLSWQDRHHPFGRMGKYLLAYIIMHHDQHRKLHASATVAREEGWLQPPFEGRPYDPKWPRPWDAIEEREWPEEFRRK